MKWIGQRIVNFISRFRNDVYIENLTEPEDAYRILVVDNYNQVKEKDPSSLDIDVSDFMSNGANNRVLTAINTDTMQAETYLLFENTENTSILKLVSNQNDADYFTIGTSTNGETTITTQDADAALANLSFKVDGDYYFIKQGNTSDYLKLEIGAHGSATFTTVDAAAAAADFEIDADGVITLDSGGTNGAINLENAGTKFADFSVHHSASYLTMYENGGASTDDYFSIFVAANGATTLRTLDADAAAANLSLEIDGSFAVSSSEINISSDGNITGASWAGGVIASAYLDADTCHLSATQTFTGAKTFSAIQTTFTNATADSPLVKILNTTDDDQAGRLMFEKLRDDDAVATGQNLGEIWFTGQDNAQNTEDYAYIVGKIDVGTGGQESGKLQFGVAAHDGSNRTALTLTGGSEAAEVDATIGLGANSVVTIPGNIDLAGDIDVDGTLETDALTIGGAAVLAQATASAVGAVELATTSEADTGTDTTRAVTPEGLKSHVDLRYAESFMTWSASGVSSMDGSDPEWIFPNTGKGIYEEDWNKDENITATSVGTTTYTVTRYSAVNGFVMPRAGYCLGFHAHGRNNNSDASFKAGLFHLEGSTTSATNNGGVDYGSTGNTNEATLRWIATADEAEASGGADGTSSHSFKGPCKLVSNTTAFAITPGDVLLPAIMGPDGSDEIFITMSIIIATPLTTIG